ncbi:MAG: hypothetical protein JWO33_2843 [Caulobacteraceae bacterium]|nr:hypothetical protein [Caulobacteraceae bacterium]
MRARSLGLAVAVLLAAVAGPAAAQDANAQDARCMIIGLFVAGQKDGAIPGGMMVNYFQGHLEGRDPKADIVKLINQEGEAFDKMADADRKAMADKCFEAMNAVRKRLEALSPAK